jgi:hypothetical protein
MGVKLAVKKHLVSEPPWRAGRRYPFHFAKAFTSSLTEKRHMFSISRNSIIKLKVDR